MGKKCPGEAMKTSPVTTGVGSLPSHLRIPGLPDSSPCAVHGPGRQIPSSDFSFYVVFNDPY